MDYTQKNLRLLRAFSYKPVEFVGKGDTKSKKAYLIKIEDLIKYTYDNTRKKIKKVGKEVIDLLIEKNKSYGDSALKPANIFANGSAVENISTWIDDKLMRIKRSGFDGFGEDNVKDLIGYLILLKIAMEEEANDKGWQKEILEREGFYTTTT